MFNLRQLWQRGSSEPKDEISVRAAELVKEGTPAFQARIIARKEMKLREAKLDADKSGS